MGASRIGKYEILARLSAGGMAEVFLCMTSGPGGFRKVVTVKRILPELREEEDFIAMFLDEARITATLSHSNIAQVFDLGEADGEYYMAMEFVPGQDLGRVMRTARRRDFAIPLGFGARVVRDLCLALHYAHHFTGPGGQAAPIVHRDISPKNAMVSYTGEVKVIDFGIAKAAMQLGRTDAGLVKGSAGYMSPEQSRGEELDGRSDLFSAGIIFYEFLTGRPLFSGTDTQRTIDRVLQVPIPSPAALAPSLPPAVCEVAMKALARERDQRFQTGKEMARAIEAAVGQALFDDDATAALMRQLFAEQMAQTLALLRANAGELDPTALKAAAGALASDPSSLPSVEVDLEELTAKTPSIRPNFLNPPPVPPDAPTVVAVDDSRSSLKLIEVALAQAAFRFIPCNSPLRALSALEEHRPDLVLLDVVMDELDGFELCRRIRERSEWRLLPILFVSAACSVEERLRGLTVGADDFIRKPYEPAELVARIKMHLHRASMMRQQAGSPGPGMPR